MGDFHEETPTLVHDLVEDTSTLSEVPGMKRKAVCSSAFGLWQEQTQTRKRTREKEMLSDITRLVHVSMALDVWRRSCGQRKRLLHALERRAAKRLAFALSLWSHRSHNQKRLALAAQRFCVVHKLLAQSVFYATWHGYSAASLCLKAVCGAVAARWRISMLSKALSAWEEGWRMCARRQQQVRSKIQQRIQIAQVEQVERTFAAWVRAHTHCQIVREACSHLCSKLESPVVFRERPVVFRERPVVVSMSPPEPSFRPPKMAEMSHVTSQENALRRVRLTPRALFPSEPTYDAKLPPEPTWMAPQLFPEPMVPPPRIPMAAVASGGSAHLKEMPAGVCT